MPMRALRLHTWHMLREALQYVSEHTQREQLVSSRVQLDLDLAYTVHTQRRSAWACYGSLRVLVLDIRVVRESSRTSEDFPTHDSLVMAE